jgi:hypothetical protein
MDKEKLKQEIKETVEKYKDLPWDVFLIQESFIEEMAEAVVSQAFDKNDFDESIKIFRELGKEIFYV